MATWHVVSNAEGTILQVFSDERAEEARQFAMRPEYPPAFIHTVQGALPIDTISMRNARRPCCGVPVNMPYEPTGCPMCNPEFWKVRR